MPQYEIYRAQSGARVEGSAPGPGVTPFTIEIRFVGGLSETQRQAFRSAADRWSRVIIGDLPAVAVENETIDDVVILAEGDEIDGPGRILGQAGPTYLRPASAGQFAFLPARGSMTFDAADLVSMEGNRTLGDVITHEMGHVLGIGTIWARKRLLQGSGTTNPTFTGTRASAEYGRLRGGGSRSVPVENTGGPGTAEGHWRETVFRTELMSGFIAAPGNAISAVTVGSLADLGYVVDMRAAEPYELPDLRELAERGDMVPHTAPIGIGIMLPTVPTVLPDTSLR